MATHARKAKPNYTPLPVGAQLEAEYDTASWQYALTRYEKGWAIKSAARANEIYRAALAAHGTVFDAKDFGALLMAEMAKDPLTAIVRAVVTARYEAGYKVVLRLTVPQHRFSPNRNRPTA